VRREPDRPHPDPLRTERHRRRHLTSRADPARREHRQRRHCIDHLRHQHHRRDLARVATRLVAGSHDDVDARIPLCERLIPATHQRRHLHPGGVRAFDHIDGRRTQSVRKQLDGMAHRDVHQRPALAGCPAEQALETRYILRKRRHVVPVEQLFQKPCVLFGDQLLEIQLPEVALRLAHVGGGNHDIDTVGLPVDVLVDPLQLALEFFGGENDRAEHAHAPRTAHGCHHVAAVAESEDRILESEGFTDRGTHLYSSAAGGAVIPRKRLLAGKATEGILVSLRA